MKDTILLIEDEIELQQNLKEILEYNGFSLVTAEHGLEGWKKLETQNVDLILCDIMMPVMDGFEFLKSVRTQERFHHLPFIFLSAKARKEDREKGIAEGADDYLVKPISARILLNAVFAALGKQKSKSTRPSSPAAFRFLDHVPEFQEAVTPVSGLIRLLELQKSAVENGDLAELGKLNGLALKSSHWLQSSFGKLSRYKNLENSLPNPCGVSLDELVLEKMEEVGREKFSVRTQAKCQPIFDRDQLRFVLRELIENALKFNQESQLIEVEWSKDEFSIKNMGRYFGSETVVKIVPFCKPIRENQDLNGLGLGLFLVHSYCQSNSAQLRCSIGNEGSFRAMVRFGELHTISLMGEPPNLN